MEYNTICHPATGMAIVRRADHGITDTEWEHGCRIKLETSEYKILDALSWSEHIASLDDPSNVPNNNYINAYPVLDKWDGGKSY